MAASVPNTTQHWVSAVAALSAALVASGAKKADNNPYSLAEAQAIFTRLTSIELAAIAGMPVVTVP